MNELKETLLEEMKIDYVDLPSILTAIREETNLSEGGEGMNSALDFLLHLLRIRGVRIGSLNADWNQFVEWPETPEEAIDRIRLAWNKIGREPNLLDDIAWFTID